MNYHCPLCGVFGLVLNDDQAFCTNDDCDAVMFVPSLPDGGMSKAKEIEWEKTFTVEGGVARAYGGGAPRTCSMCGTFHTEPSSCPAYEEDCER
jgi:hypothetical protein